MLHILPAVLSYCKFKLKTNENKETEQKRINWNQNDKQLAYNHFSIIRLITTRIKEKNSAKKTTYSIRIKFLNITILYNHIR